MSLLSLGFYSRPNDLIWALSGFGKQGWGLVEAGTFEGPIESAIQSLKKKWPRGIRPRIGVPFGRTRCRTIIGDRKTSHIISAERIDQGDETLLVKVVPFGEDRMSVSLPRNIVADLMTPWRDAGIEPMDVEPLEIAWSRAYPHADALIHMPSLNDGNLVVFSERQIHTERLPDLSEGLETHEITSNIVEHIRQARGNVEKIQTAVIHGNGLDDIPSVDGDLESTHCSIGGEMSPTWADAFVLSLAAAVIRK